MSDYPICDVKDCPGYGTAHPPIEPHTEVRDYRDRPDLPSHITLGELRVLHHFAERIAGQGGGSADSSETEIALIVRDRGQEGEAAPASWVEFDMCGRKFGIWRHTLKLYEADEHGAMGEDEVRL